MTKGHVEKEVGEDKAQSLDPAYELAKRFHEAYERLAPQFGYKTREESAKPWESVPVANQQLMTAVCAEMLAREVIQHAPRPQADIKGANRLLIELINYLQRHSRGIDMSWVSKVIEQVRDELAKVGEVGHTPRSHSDADSWKAHDWADRVAEMIFWDEFLATSRPRMAALILQFAEGQRTYSLRQEEGKSE